MTIDDFKQICGAQSADSLLGHLNFLRRSKNFIYYMFVFDFFLLKTNILIRFTGQIKKIYKNALSSSSKILLFFS